MIKNIKLSYKYGLNKLVKFNNGIKECKGYIREIRFKLEGTFYFIECSEDVYYEISESKLTLVGEN